MQSRFEQYVNENNMFSKDDKVLLAVSGGADSVSMAYLFYKAGIETAIAHCNFRLRGEESDGDEIFVREFAGQLEMPFYVMHFNTEEYAKLQKVSIQMAARELRYNWFENLRRIHGYQYIAIAHNADDAIETFFINLFRGTGLHGLTGIRPINGNLVRPILFAFRNEIEEFCAQNNLQYHTDSSNQSDKYLRNQLRHELMPAISRINPEFKLNMQDNFLRLSDAEKIYNAFLQKFTEEKLVHQNDGSYTISIEAIKNSPAPTTVLFELLKNFGFSSKTSFEIFENLDGESGSLYFSRNYRLIKDRSVLIVDKSDEKEEIKVYIDNDLQELESPVHLKFSIHSSVGFQILHDKNSASLDLDKLVFPLMMRKWQKGDSFQPLGMRGFKKVSDFFVDIKLSISEKENAWLLTSGGEIIWIVGMRTDDRFKITSGTMNILTITKID
jgi:tRNA(Ile)-lysidine synthase